MGRHDSTDIVQSYRETHLFSKDLTCFTWYDVVLCSKSCDEHIRMCVVCAQCVYLCMCYAIKFKSGCYNKVSMQVSNCND